MVSRLLFGFFRVSLSLVAVHPPKCTPSLFFGLSIVLHNKRLHVEITNVSTWRNALSSAATYAGRFCPSDSSTLRLFSFDPEAGDSLKSASFVKSCTFSLTSRHWL